MTTEDESLRIDETMVEAAAHSTLNLSLLDESLINELIESNINDIDVYDFGLGSNILELDTVSTTKARISQTQENKSASSETSYKINKENARNGSDFLETYAPKIYNEGVSECNRTTKLFNNRQKSIVKQRSWDRKNCCCYCRQLVTNFTRHIKRKHCNEIEVMQLMAISSDNLKEKKKKTMEITNILRNRGNFVYNSEAVSNEDGKILPARRTLRYQTALPSSPSTFVICRKCLGTFRRATFYKHFKNCDQDSKANDDSLKRKSVISTKALSIIANVQGATEQLKQFIIPHLRNDEISLIVKQDDLILAYGSRLLKKKKERRSRKAIASRMRDLATLLKIIRTKNNEVKSLRDVLKAKYFENFIESVKEMSGFDNQSGFVNITSVPARIRPAVVACLEIIYTQSILDSTILESQKEDIKKTVNEFKLLIEANWQWEISSNADKSRKKKLMTKDQILPFDGDIKTVMAKIHELESQYSKEDLQKEVTILNYENMCEVTIAHIILLDRKRSGDVAEAELSYYLNRKKDEIPLQVLQMLTKEQRKSIDQLDIFQIPGKRTRAVPVLLTKAMRQNLDLLITCRKKLKIKDNNLYLFARPLTDEPFDGGKCLNRIKSMCSLKNPSMLTSTGLRHHAATMSQVHATQDDNYTEHLASFLGHDVSVHMKNYRLPLQVLQKGIVGSKLVEIENLRNAIDNNSKIVDNSNEKNVKLPEEQYASSGAKKIIKNQKTYKNIKEYSDQSGKIYHIKENIKPIEGRRITRNQQKNFTESSSDISISPPSLQKEVIRRKKKVHLRWTEEEIAIVNKHFKKYIEEKKNPGKAACLDVLKKEPKLHNRAWEQLNSYVNNIYKKK